MFAQASSTGKGRTEHPAFLLKILLAIVLSILLIAIELTYDQLFSSLPELRAAWLSKAFSLFMGTTLNDSLKLSVRHQKFVDAILSGEDQTNSYLKAGYKVSNEIAAVRGSELVRKSKVAEYIALKRSEMLQKADVSRDRVMREYARLAFLDPRKAFTESGELKDFSDLDDDTAAAIAGVDVDELFEGRGENREMTGYTKRVKFWNKVGSLDSISKIMGYMKDGGGTVVNNIVIRDNR